MKTGPLMGALFGTVRNYWGASQYTADATLAGLYSAIKNDEDIEPWLDQIRGHWGHDHESLRKTLEGIRGLVDHPERRV